jgi:HEAT repeat protein
MAERFVKRAEAPAGFPWIRAIFVVAALALLYPGYLVITDVIAARRASDDAWVRTVRADREGAEAIRGAAGENYDRRNANYQEQVDAAIERLRSGDRGLCAAAMFLGRAREKAAVEPLIAAARGVDIDNGSLACVVGALADIGESAVAAGYYNMWIDGDDPDLWRSAISGFGDLGADAPASAIEGLERAMLSEHWAMRMLAVMSAAKIGENAEPVLQAAAEDEHPMVRAEARNALKKLQ